MIDMEEMQLLLTDTENAFSKILQWFVTLKFSSEPKEIKAIHEKATAYVTVQELRTCKR